MGLTESQRDFIERIVIKHMMDGKRDPEQKHLLYYFNVEASKEKALLKNLLKNLKQDKLKVSQACMLRDYFKRALNDFQSLPGDMFSGRIKDMQEILEKLRGVIRANVS